MKNKFRLTGITLGRLLSKGAAICAFAGLMFAASCSSSDDNSAADEQTGGRAISFRMGESAVRGSITATADLKKIGVFGYSHTGDFADDLTNRKADYFLNKAVIYTNSAWSYDGVTKYWPIDGRKVSFFAYAPYQDVENTFILSPQANSELAVPTIEYTVPADVTKQVDLLWNNQPDKNGGTVTFDMDHALTRVGFEAQLDAAELDRPYTITITDISVTNVMGGGKLSLVDGSWDIATPATDADLTSYSLTTANGGGLNTFVFNGQYDSTNPGENEVDPTGTYALTTADGYLMLLPQALSDGSGAVSAAQVEITYEVKNLLSGNVVTETATKDLAGVTTWDAGKGITYLLTISRTNGVILEVEVGNFLGTDEWQPGGSDDIVIS